jgi:hypothetical protein
VYREVYKEESREYNREHRVEGVDEVEREKRRVERG